MSTPSPTSNTNPADDSPGANVEASDRPLQSGDAEWGEHLSEPTLRILGGVFVLVGVCMVAAVVWLFVSLGIMTMLLWTCTVLLGLTAAYVAWKGFSPSADQSGRKNQLVAGATLAVFSLLCCWSLFNALDGPEPSANTEPSNQPSPPSDPSPASKTAIATQQNWNRMREILATLDNVGATGQQESLPVLIENLASTRAAYANASTQLSRLPVQSVDPQVVALTADYMRLLDHVGVLLSRLQQIYTERQQLENHANSSEAFVESALRGFLGDPLGKYYEIQEHNEQLGSQYKDVQREAHQVALEAADLRSKGHLLRATMGSKHDVEFLPIN